MMVLLETLSLMMIFVNVLSKPKDRDGKGNDPGSSSRRQKLNNWDVTIIGHRGGASGFIPEHSLLSYTIGAQHGADYLEPDITFTSDGEQILRHHPDLEEATNVNEIYGKDSNKYTEPDTIEYYWRTMDEGGPSIHPYMETSGGYFSWDFTYLETQNLSLISDDMESSPLDVLNLNIMTFEELLILNTEQLIPILNRPIGLIPEIKYHHEYTQLLGYDVEIPH
eukprot:79046_1